MKITLIIQVPTKGTTEEAQAGGYTFPPEQAKEYDYNHYYMHYYQQAYNVWSGKEDFIIVNWRGVAPTCFNT